MAVKQTIAFIGKEKELCADLINKLTEINYPLLLISNDKNQFSQLPHKIKQRNPNADIEAIECLRDGCWEADIIMLLNNVNFDEGFLEKIKTVATQKIIAYISATSNTTLVAGKIKQLEQILPHSKVVHIYRGPDAATINVIGDNKEAINVISTIFIDAGYLIAA